MCDKCKIMGALESNAQYIPEEGEVLMLADQLRGIVQHYPREAVLAAIFTVVSETVLDVPEHEVPAGSTVDDIDSYHGQIQLPNQIGVIFNVMKLEQFEGRMVTRAEAKHLSMQQKKTATLQ